jgi:AraC family transcriptional regulator
MPLERRRPRRPAEPLRIEVTSLAPQRVAYMKHVGPYEVAHRVWLDFTARLKKDGLPRENSLLIGVPLDNPRVTPPEKLRYHACVTVDESYVPAKPVRVRMLAGGDYVVARNCPVRSLAQGYEALFRTWLPRSGRIPRKAPSLLVTVKGPEGVPSAWGFRDIYVPLRSAN